MSLNDDISDLREKLNNLIPLVNDTNKKIDGIKEELILNFEISQKKAALSLKQHKALIYFEQGLRVTDIARKMKVSKVMVCHYKKRLELKGFLDVKKV